MAHQSILPAEPAYGVRIGDLLLTPSRAVVHLPTRTAIIADLHLGYSQARRRNGEAVPERNLSDELTRLESLHGAGWLHNLIVAGDVVEKSDQANLVNGFRTWLAKREVKLIGIVPGNHDGALGELAEEKIFFEKMDIGSWQIIHGDGRLPHGNIIQGHVHPCVRLSQGVAAPCFLVHSSRLILPAFSDEASGVNVLGYQRWHGFRCLAIAGDQILDLGNLGFKHAEAISGGQAFVGGPRRRFRRAR